MARVWKIAGLVLASACASVPGHAQVAPAAVQSSADARLNALYTGYAAWEAREFQYFENPRGETKPTAHLAHVDAASQQRRAAHLRDLLSQLNAIPAAQLSPEERVNAAVLRTLLEN